jgi:hypothetical protein
MTTESWLQLAQWIIGGAVCGILLLVGWVHKNGREERARMEKNGNEERQKLWDAQHDMENKTTASMLRVSMDHMQLKDDFQKNQMTVSDRITAQGDVLRQDMQRTVDPIKQQLTQVQSSVDSMRGQFDTVIDLLRGQK